MRGAFTNARPGQTCRDAKTLQAADLTVLAACAPRQLLFVLWTCFRCEKRARVARVMAAGRGLGGCAGAPCKILCRTRTVLRK